MRRQRAYTSYCFANLLIHLKKEEEGWDEMDSHNRHLDAVLQNLGDAQF